MKRHPYAFFALRLILPLLLLASTVPAWSAKLPQVPPKYAHWLKEEVPYLISNDERTEFLNLTSDEARDSFIAMFWKSRNPDPNAPTNALQDEHYKRIAYANDKFGHANLQDGWRSDRGMVYITLGEPQQRARYPETKYLRPMEIWFYQSTNSALSTHFYVVFFKQSISEDYRLYSPYGDRPQKLISTGDAVNNDALAVKIIDRDLGAETARISLSLLPGEPVDLKQAEPSLQSDVLLNNIRNYRNLPSNTEMLAERRALLTGVSHRIILGEQFSEFNVIPSRGAGKRVDLSYLFRFRHPEDFVLTRQVDDRYYYSLSVEAVLVGPDEKVLYQDVRELTDYLSNEQVKRIKEQCFALEGRLPAAPGSYELRVKVTNNASTQTFRQSSKVLIPDFDRPLGISPVLFAANAPPERARTVDQPFSYSGVKLAASGGDNAVISQGAPLRVVYQLWEPPADPVSLRGKSIEVKYLIGQLGSEDKREETQTVDQGDFDPSGSLLMGKDLRTDELRPGNYRLVISAASQQPAGTSYQSLRFEITNQPTPTLWTATVPSSMAEGEAGTDWYRRGVAALANHLTSLAVEYLQQAVQAAPENAAFYKALALGYRSQGNLSAAAEADKRVTTLGMQKPAAKARD